MGFIDTAKDIFGQYFGDPDGGPYGWQGRLAEAAYTPPSAGMRFVFEYEDLQKSFDPKATVFEFPGAKGKTYVQQNGRTGDRIPMRVIFWGDDHDVVSAAFEIALSEEGFGLLEHPLYGNKDVKMVGPMRRRDDLVSAANQTIFECEFYQTIRELYPAANANTAGDAAAAIAAYNEAAAAQLKQKMSLESFGETQGFLDTVNKGLDNVNKAMKATADVQQAAADNFNDIADSINRSIDVLVRDPLTLARQTCLMIQAPARVAGGVSARLSAYGNLLTDVAEGYTALAPNSTTDKVNSNGYWANDLFASGAVSGKSAMVLGTKFDNATQAISAAVSLADDLETLTAWKDDQIATLADGVEVRDGSETDSTDAFNALQSAVYLSIAYLFNLSTTLQKERILVLDRPRHVLELIAELYDDDPDNYIDEIIARNDLNNLQLIELPRGFEFAYVL